MTVGSQRALGASWLQTDEARNQAHIELRHLGLPTALAPDLLAAAAYQLALDLSARDAAFPADDPLTPAYRAVQAAARAMLRSRRTARLHPLHPVSGSDGDPHLPSPTTADGLHLHADHLKAGREVTDHRRHVVSGLAVDRPHERSAALTVLTLATEPRIEPTVDHSPAADPGDVGRFVWAGLTYAGRAATLPAGNPLVTDRRDEVARREHQAEAIAAVERLLAEALDTEHRDAEVHDRTDHDPTARSGSSANELVHRRAAHG